MSRKKTSKSTSRPGNFAAASELEDIMGRMREIALGAERRTGQTPPRADPSTIRLLHAQAYANAKQEQISPSAFACRQTFCGDMHCSRKPLLELRSMLIGELKMEMKHVGRYLLVRVVEPCFKMSGMMSVVEDRSGTITILSMYNCIRSAATDVEAVLPLGTILAIKEPYYKFSNTNSCVIRVDSPSDVLVLETFGPNNGIGVYNAELAEALALKDVKWSTAPPRYPFPAPSRCSDEDELRQLQLEATHKLHYRDVAYISTRLWKMNVDAETISARHLKRHVDGDPSSTSHLKTHVEANTQAQLLMIRAFALNQTGQYEAAFDDLKWILERDPADTSALTLASQALRGLRRFEEAERLLTALCRLPLDPTVSGTDAPVRKRMLAEARARLAECRDGKYDLKVLSQEAASVPNPRLDHADYVGPVRVERHPEGGFRVVTTTAVTPGTLLMACKALEIVWSSELADGASAHTLINFKNSLVSGPTHCQLVTQLALRLLENPSTCVGLYDLPAATGPSGLYADSLTQREPVADVGQLHWLVSQHSAVPHRYDSTMLRGSMPEDAEDEEGRREPHAGLWVLPSFVAHACCASACPTFIGDFMFLRAKHHLKVGEEVTLPRTEAIASLADRSESLAARGISCYCGMCEAERAEPQSLRTRRAELLRDLASRFHLGQSDDLQVITEIIDGLKATYAGSPSPIQQQLYLPYTALGAVHLSRDARGAAAQAFELALRSLGFTREHEEYLLGVQTQRFPRTILMHLAPMTAVHVYNYYWHAGCPELAERWLHIAKGLDRILHGGDEAVFKMLYKSFVAQ